MFKITDLNKNLVSGLLVSFIALPLCIAISIASGFPVLSGIITAIIGGVLVSQISGSNVTINGPAAGMIVVILDSVQKLGNGDSILGYKLTLGAIVVASALQIATSFTSLPNLMRKFPEVVIRGMMCAIGLIVILKQVFTMFGYKIPKDGMIKLITDVPQAFLGMQLETFFIGIFTIFFIILWNKKIAKIPTFSKIPVYLIVIIFGSVLGHVMNISENKHFLIQSYSSTPSSLFLALPDSILDAFSFPKFQSIASWNFILSVLTIFAVGSIETTLSAIAVDKMDPQKRNTNLQKDLRGVAIGNAICGFVGALPMIAEVVRSSANIKYGATNKSSNFFHGLFILIMVGLLGFMLHLIPMCVLAAMLILIGWNLINVKLVKDMCCEYKLNLPIILSVVFFTLYIDLLVGITSGLIIYSIGKVLVKNARL